MRGNEEKQTTLLCLLNVEERVPQDHPLRPIKRMAEEALASMSPLFESMYSRVGRPSIPPETLLKSQLLIALYTVRSDRLFCEQLEWNLLWRWFLNMDAVSWGFDHSTFSKNRERFVTHDVSGEFFKVVVEQARVAGLLSSEHFSVDGTLIEAWASMKSFRPKDDADNDNNGWADFRGKKRKNDTHESKTDPEAKLFRKGKGKEAKLCYMGHGLMENRNHLLVGIEVTQATGTAERDAAALLLDQAPRDGPRTLGGDKGYDTKDFVAACRARNVTPHVAQNTSRRRSAIDGRTTRHPGYRASEIVRRMIEGIFGWMKTTGGARKTRFRGAARVRQDFVFRGAAYNLLRIGKLIDGATA